MIHAFRFFCFSEYVCYCDRKEVDELLSCKKYFSNAVNVLELLDDMRDAFNAPITISSGFRNREHNARVGGSITSQHMVGAAADIKFVRNRGYNFIRLARFILDNPDRFGQVICYIPDLHKEEVYKKADYMAKYDPQYDLALLAAQLECSRWIHVALPSDNHPTLCITQNYLKL